MTPNEALVAAVTVEHQVIYGYGVAGAHLRGADRRRALVAFDRHRLRRDQLTTSMALAKATPPAAAPAYELPFPVTGPTSARALLAQLEEACAGAAWDLTAATPADSSLRRLAVQWLADAATAGAYWRGGTLPSALPGSPAG